jgi:hypothetical protein
MNRLVALKLQLVALDGIHRAERALGCRRKGRQVRLAGLWLLDVVAERAVVERLRVVRGTGIHSLRAVLDADVNAAVDLKSLTWHRAIRP